jgi:hypothetical protein
LAESQSAPATPARDALPAKMQVKRLVVARGVRGREPVDPSSRFTLGPSPLVAFVEVGNRGDAPGEIVIAFEKGATRAGNIELAVPGHQPRWRTWGRTHGIKEPGRWDVVVRERGGRELARLPFEVSSS